MVENKTSGCPRRGLDTIIAIAVANDCIFIAENERDCASIKTINLLRGASATNQFEGD